MAIEGSDQSVRSGQSFGCPHGASTDTRLSIKEWFMAPIIIDRYKRHTDGQTMSENRQFTDYDGTSEL